MSLLERAIEANGGTILRDCGTQLKEDIERNEFTLEKLKDIKDNRKKLIEQGNVDMNMVLLIASICEDEDMIDYSIEQGATDFYQVLNSNEATKNSKKYIKKIMINKANGLFGRSSRRNQKRCP